MHKNDKKVDVVKSYLVLGTIPLVSAVTGVPQETIRAWKKTAWWQDLEDQIRGDEDVQLDSKLSKAIDTTLEVTMDRLENGDFLLDSRTGTIKRVPVKMKDAHRVMVDTLTQRNLMRGKPTTITSQETVQDSMNKLAATFKEWANLIKQNEKVVEGEIIEESISGNSVHGDAESTNTDQSMLSVQQQILPKFGKS